MPPEELEDLGAWLTKATHDLQAAEYLSQAEEPLLDIVVYHCQQAMEKALKGFLTFKNSPFAKIHALVPLVEQAAEFDAGFEDLLDHAENLSPFAWRFRYPGELLEPDESEARDALELAREALDFVLDRVPEDARPGQLREGEAHSEAATTAELPPQVKPTPDEAGSETGGPGSESET